MPKDTKIIIGVIVATLAIIVGGIFLTSKSPSGETATPNPEILIGKNSYKVVAPNEKDVLVEFGDLQCPACAAYHPFILQAKEEFKDSLTYVFRNFPLTQHKNAIPAAYALEAAGLQGKYWEMQDKLYGTQEEWSDLSDSVSKFSEYAKVLGLDETKFKSDMDSSEIKDKVKADYADGIILKVDSTPTFFLNGVKITFQNYEQLKNLISQ